MSRPHGKARVSSRSPLAFAVCDRCGALYNHRDLNWQFDWEGPRLQNLEILVCKGCLDKPFEHNRTIILPPDPIPIPNPRFELYATDANPVSLPSPNFDPLLMIPENDTPVTMNGSIGNMTGGAGVNAPFYGLTNSSFAFPASSLPSYHGATPGPSRKAYQGALKIPSLSGLLNYVGQNWGAQPGAALAQASSLTYQVVTYGLLSFKIQAPSDQPFLFGSGSIAAELDGWSGSAWTPLWNGNTAGTTGETLSVSLSASAQGYYYGHRILLAGDGVSAIGVAQVQFTSLGTGVLKAPPTANPS